MIKPSSDRTRLLAAAISLVHTPRPESFDTVQIGSSRYRLMTEQHERIGWVVVLMQESGEDALCDDVLKSCYGLTSRQIEVARLLAERQSNKEIAALLDVTVYTAGRHTENVLRKLGVASRRDVRDKLRGYA
jgi:DNA-binding NarL/FixJ family response regulator